MPRTELFSRVRRALRVADHLERTRQPLEQAVEDWSRRRFLRTSATAAAGVALFPCIARAANNDARVVILGAGTAGLTCAYRLQQAGIHATILEASPRAGGRMYSLQNFFPDDQIAELGGELIDTEHVAIRNLARELGVELIDLAYLDHSNGHDFFIDGQLTKADADWIEAFRPIAEMVRRDIGKDAVNCGVTWNSGTARGKELDRVSIDEWLQRNQVTGAIRKVIEVAYVGEFGAELWNLSSLNFLCNVGTGDDTFGVFGDSNERFRCKTGNGTIPIRLAQELDREVSLGSAIESIRNRGTGFELAVRRGPSSTTIRADVLVTTIPLTVMRTLDLRNLDLTPTQRATIMSQPYGTNSKMMVGLNARPWVEMNVSAYTFTDLPFQACWDTSRGQSGQHAVLTNFTGGRQGLVVGEGSLQDRAREFVAQADKVFPGTVEAYTGKAVRQVWPKYEWSRGSYAAFGPGDYQKYYRALVEPQGRLIFAGEHTADEFGFMNSAVETGERAARQVLHAIGSVRERAA